MTSKMVVHGIPRSPYVARRPVDGGRERRGLRICRDGAPRLFMALRVMLISPSTTQDRTAGLRVFPILISRKRSRPMSRRPSRHWPSPAGLLGRDRQAGMVLPRSLPH